MLQQILKYTSILDENLKDGHNYVNEVKNDLKIIQLYQEATKRKKHWYEKVQKIELNIITWFLSKFKGYTDAFEDIDLKNTVIVPNSLYSKKTRK